MSVGRDKTSAPAPVAHSSAGEQGELPDLEVADVFESPEYSTTDYEMEAIGDLA